jgi:hypothetical protein
VTNFRRQTLLAVSFVVPWVVLAQEHSPQNSGGGAEQPKKSIEETAQSWLEGEIKQAEARGDGLYSDSELNATLDRIFSESLRNQADDTVQNGQPLFPLLLRIATPSPALKQLQQAFRKRYFKVLWSFVALSQQKWIQDLLITADKIYDQEHFDRCERLIDGTYRAKDEARKSDGKVQICDLDERLRLALAKRYGEELMNAYGQAHVWSLNGRPLFRTRAAYFRAEGILALDFSENILSNLLTFVHESIHVTDLKALDAYNNSVKNLPQTVAILKKYGMRTLAERLVDRVSGDLFHPENGDPPDERELKALREILDRSESATANSRDALEQMDPAEVVVLKRFFKSYYDYHTGPEIRAHYLTILLYQEFSSEDCCKSILPRSLYLKGRKDALNGSNDGFSDPRSIVVLLDLMEKQDALFDGIEATPYSAAVIATHTAGIMEARAEHVQEITEIEKTLPDCLRNSRTRLPGGSLVPWVQRAFVMASQTASVAFVRKLRDDIQVIATYLSGKASQIVLRATDDVSLLEVESMDDLSFPSLGAARQAFDSRLQQSIPSWALFRDMVPQLQAVTLYAVNLEKQTDEMFRKLSTELENRVTDDIQVAIADTKKSLSDILDHEMELYDALAVDPHPSDRAQLSKVVTYMKMFLENYGIQRNASVAFPRLDRAKIETLRNIGRERIRQRKSYSDYVLAAFIDETGAEVAPEACVRSLADLQARRRRTFSVIDYSLSLQSGTVTSNQSGTFIFDTISRGRAVGAFIDAFGVGVAFQNGMRIYLQVFPAEFDTVKYHIGSKSGISMEYTVINRYKNIKRELLRTLTDVTKLTPEIRDKVRGVTLEFND